jgi:hypothetical protein
LSQGCSATELFSSLFAKQHREYSSDSVTTAV